MAVQARAKREVRPRSDVRARILRGAAALFAQRGIRGVGVDALLGQCGIAKGTLYRYFPSKEKLVLAVLELREHDWMERWQRAALNRGQDPASALLAIFDVYDEWVRSKKLGGAIFTRTLIEEPQGSSIHRAAVKGFNDGTAMIAEEARKAGLRDPVRFARTWQMLVEGCFFGACAGNSSAAKEAREAAEILLNGWQKVSPQSANGRA